MKSIATYKKVCIFAFASSVVCVQAQTIQSQNLLKDKSLESLVYDTCNGTHTGLAPLSKGELFSKLLFMPVQTNNLQGVNNSNPNADVQHNEIVQKLSYIFNLQSAKSIKADLYTLVHAFITHPDFYTYNQVCISDMLFTVQIVTDFFSDSETITKNG